MERSSVLGLKSNLIKLNGELTGASASPSVGSTQLYSFQALCQTHQDQLDSVLQEQSMAISSAPSTLDAQLLASDHSSVLFRLAEEQRYAHEYGDVSVHEPPVNQPELHTQRQLGAHLSGSALNSPPARTGSCMNPRQKIRATRLCEDDGSRSAVKAPRIHLRTMAAMVIQRWWRTCRERRCGDCPQPPAKAHGRLSPPGMLDSCKKRTEPLNEHYAATTIQAVWRGRSLRRRLSRALALARAASLDQDVLEEVDVAQFVCAEVGDDPAEGLGARPSRGGTSPLGFLSDNPSRIESCCKTIEASTLAR
ncbi:hypothetical protein P4O66_018225 [Electrophorus voltai]|uniref:Uncharacterized protein n=1 Tax=Electrophorus voltai TaxID=2609070 RepID=A0AAD8YSZ8_9TELE|nr:hypothetical protein P4O66_018225 [Electrophorus voltai]